MMLSINRICAQRSVGILRSAAADAARHTRASYSYHTACHVHFLRFPAKLPAQERHFGNCIRRGASTRRACAGRMPRSRERQKEKEEARRRIANQPVPRTTRRQPRSTSSFFLLTSDFIVRRLTFANFVNFCSNFLWFLCSDLFCGLL